MEIKDRVLIVEDDKNIRKFIQTILAKTRTQLQLTKFPGQILEKLSATSGLLAKIVLLTRLLQKKRSRLVLQ